jgi:putative molybdopterin biosynthesis protein
MLDQSNVISVLTVDEAAQELKISPATVYRMVWKGELPAFRIGRLVRIERSDLLSLMQRLRGAGDE